MQVKKFEARTMKEALEMVKAELGPDAIILSARDNNRSYGLVGDGSVEITAAVSEETLQRKKFAEARLRDEEKQKFAKSSARSQKDLIEKMVNKHLEKNKAPRAITSQRYIDIDEDPMAHAVQDTRYASEAAQVRVRNAAQRAMSVMQDQLQPARQKTAPTPVLPILTAAPPKAPASVAQATVAKAMESAEMQSLKNEIANLKQVLAHFQSIPQNFVQGHPGADFGLPYDLSFVFEKLIQAGVAPEIAADICEKAQKELPSLKLKNRSLVEGWVARRILETTKTTSAEENRDAKVHVFVGAAGSGKTTALVKMASHLVVRENKKVAILSADTFKVGASDQMRIYAQILNVPFTVIRNATDWYQIMNYMNSVDYILVDYPGLSLRNAEEGMNLKRLMPPASMKARVHLVLSTLAKDQDTTELGRRYSVLDYQDVIFTGLDESVQHGTIYNFMRRFDVPLHSFGIGTRVPEDFEFATKERVLDLLFKITQANKQEQQVL
ncbi:flagellar biosynthesis protein FlhF [Bdellovibrio sp. HCB337]|uniref:flagellar biosynthesis protein FlhF n=1 Tax=Bdellovibrio sp. HCB337 TaxID=3394358 RepID=UPI0039A41EE1